MFVYTFFKYITNINNVEIGKPGMILQWSKKNVYLSSFISTKKVEYRQSVHTMTVVDYKR